MWPLGGIEFGCACKQEETDLGGDKKLHKILVQNLEKELSSSTVTKFIHKQTSIATRVYIPESTVGAIHQWCHYVELPKRP